MISASYKNNNALFKYYVKIIIETNILNISYLTFKGFIYFNSVINNFKDIKVGLMKREILFDEKIYEPDYLATYEII